MQYASATSEIKALDRISSSVIEDLLKENRLRKDGVTFRHVVDPHDILQFCFPVDVESSLDIDVDAVVHDQIAGYELFYLDQEKPILAPEYHTETYLLLRAIEKDFFKGYQKVEMIEELLRAADFDSEEFKRLADSQEGLRKIIEEDFQLLLAVVLGLHSLAAERFREIFDDRLELGFAGPKTRKARKIIEKYRKSDHFSFIKDSLEVPIHTLPSDVQLKAQRALLRDAKIIDRLIQLNSQQIRVLESGDTDKVTLYLYVSSAVRSRILFQKGRFRRILPKIEEEPFSFIRTREHLLATALTRTMKSQKKIDFDKTEESLTELLDLAAISELKSFRPECAECILGLGGGSGSVFSCEQKPLCESIRRVRQSIAAKQEAFENLRVAERIRKYRVIGKRKGRKKGGKYSSLIEQIQILYKTGLGDWAVERRLRLLEMVDAKSRFARLVPDIYPQSIQRGREAVTVRSQDFPLRAKFTKDPYRRIADDVTLYLGSSERTDASARQKIIQIYSDFLELDARIGEEDHEHELLRNLLYLTFFTPTGYENAFKSCRREIGGIVPEGLVAEFYYVAVWAGRLAECYEEAEGLASKAVELFPEDYRFFHGRQLVRFAWLTDEDATAPADFSLAECIADTEQAIDLLAEDPSRDEEMLAANYNNLAYLYSFEWEDPSFDLAKARRALVQLKQFCLRETEWSNFPEYYHTEANLEYYEAQGMLEEEDSLERVMEKLFSARDAIGMAVNLFPEKRGHREVQTRINNLIRELVSTG